MRRSSNSIIDQLRIKPIALAIGISILSGCGGASSSGESTGDGGIIGTAKIPNITALSTIEAKSSSGDRQTAAIDANGKFNIETTNGEIYLLRTKPQQSARAIIVAGKETSEFFYSIAHTDATNEITRNIHPFTDLIIRNWFATQSLDIDAEFEKAGAITDLPSLAEINAIETEIEGIVSQQLINANITNGVDLLATPFDINNIGFDNFLNNNIVLIEDEKVTITFNQNNGNAQGVSVNQLPISTDFTDNNDNPPTTPTGLNAQAIDDTTIALQWNASTDDKGISGYNIFRNGSQISTSSFPSFTDTDLDINTNYSYRIQAIDSRNQLSDLSQATNPIVLATSTPPQNTFDGTYNVTVISTTVASICGNASGTYTLTNGTDITGSVSNGSSVFDVSGTRNISTGDVTGGFAFVSGQQFATFTGIIDESTSRGTFEDINGCVGTWEGIKAN
ncbi:MAG: fibronectin type III domain-containing protein [Cocleimonas sp.]